jgi:methylmalonyl-CoA/ethylmalonyl-CoA epimerase
MSVEKLDHVAVAVSSVADACRLFIDALGGVFVGGGDNPRLGVRAVQIAFPPGSKVELLQPVSEDGFLAEFIRRHGEGFHHVTLYVDDVETMDAQISSAGFGTVDLSLERASWQEIFTRPGSTFGALIQLSKPADPWPVPVPGITLDDVLTGKVQVLDNVITWKESGEEIWPGPSGD